MKFVENRNFKPEIEIVIKNRTFYHKSKFLSQIEIFIKNRNFRQTSKCRTKSKYCIFCSKIMMFTNLENHFQNIRGPKLTKKTEKYSKMFKIPLTVVPLGSIATTE